MYKQVTKLDTMKIIGPLRKITPGIYDPPDVSTELGHFSDSAGGQQS